MAIKRKEKQLTKEELVAKYLKERGPHWYYSQPLFIPWPTKEGPKLFGLNPNIDNKILLVFSGDSASYFYDAYLSILKFLHKRYANLNWWSAAVLPLNHPFLTIDSVRNSFFAIRDFHCPAIYLDISHEYEKCFPNPEGITASIACFMQGELIEIIPLSGKLDSALFRIENLFQTELRKNDPGLPLALLKQREGMLGEYRETQHTMKDGLTGHWFPSATFMASDDPKSFLTLNVAGKSLKAIFDLSENAAATQKVYVSLNGAPLPERLHEDLFRSNIKGESFFEVSTKMKPLTIYQSEEKVEGQLKFEFRDALESQVRYSGAFEKL